MTLADGGLHRLHAYGSCVRQGGRSTRGRRPSAIPGRSALARFVWVATLALGILLIGSQAARAADPVSISIDPAGSTTVHEGFTQFLTVSGFIPGGSEANRVVELELQYVGLTKDDISLRVVPGYDSSITSDGQINSIFWDVEQGATEFSFQLKVSVWHDADVESGNQLVARGNTRIFGESEAIDSNTVTLNIEDNHPPEFGPSTATREVDENTPFGGNVGSPVSATDPDGHNLVYTLSGTDAAYFNIRDDNGQLSARRVFDYESRSAYKVVVTAADQGARTDVVRVSIEIQDIDEPPDFDTTSPTLTVAENTATDTTTGKTVGSPVTATDPEGSTVSYLLVGTDAASFAIDSNSGQITTAAQLDRETKAEHSVTVTASDPAGNQASNDVTIRLTNVNEPPAYATASTSLSIVENSAGPIGPVAPNDVDDSSHSYALSGTDAASFAIDNSGRLTAAANLDYENPDDTGGTTAGDNIYAVTVTATDPGALSDMIDVAITVTNAAQEKPLAPRRGAPALDGDHTATDATLTAKWLAPDNTGRPTITGYDVDYRLTAGTPTWTRQTAAATARTTTITGLNFNSKYEVQVRAVNNDGAGPWLHLGEIIAATLAQLRLSFAPLDITLSETTTTPRTVNVFMDLAADRPVAVTLDVSARTLNAVESGDYTLSTSTLNFASGEGGDPFTPTKTFTITPRLDDDTDEEWFSISFGDLPQRVTGGETNFGVIITDPDGNAKPSFQEVSTMRRVDENTAAGVAIGLPVTALDTPSGKTGDSTTLTYGLAGSDASEFQIDAQSGQIKTLGALNYSAKSVYTVWVTVNDGKDRDGNTDTSEDDRVEVTIDVLDLDEAPDAPTAPTVVADSSTSLMVSWTAPTNTGPAITDYNLRYRIADNAGSFTDAGYDGTATSTTLSGLFTNTAYDVEVQAINDEGASGWSTSGQGTTGLIPLEVTYESDSYETVEHGLVGVRVDLNQRANRRIEIPISVTSASGTDTGDYTVEGLTNDRLTFEPGTDQKVFTVTGNPDGDAADEEVSLAFDTAALPAGVTEGTSSTSTLRILDLPGVAIASTAVAPVTGPFRRHLHLLGERDWLLGGQYHGWKRFGNERPHGRSR